MKNNPITAWKKFNIKSQKWKHNHIENGHITGNKPIGTIIQTENWNKNTWIYEHLYITKNYRIVKEENTWKRICPICKKKLIYSIIFIG